MPIVDAHPVFDMPPPDARLWRYMDVAKLLSLLHKGELWFPSAQALGDPFEGSFSRVNIDTSLDSVPEEHRARVRNSLSHFRRTAPGHTFISCWHESAWESATMWRLYLKTDDGLAISTSVKRLRESLQGALQDIYVGRVHYIDYGVDAMPIDNMFWPFVHKRRSYEHEREVRAVISEMPVPIAASPPAPRSGSPFPSSWTTSLNVSTSHRRRPIGSSMPLRIF